MFIQAGLIEEPQAGAFLHNIEELNAAGTFSASFIIQARDRHQGGRIIPVLRKRFVICRRQGLRRSTILNAQQRAFVGWMFKSASDRNACDARAAWPVDYSPNVGQCPGKRTNDQAAGQLPQPDTLPG
jgi:hypothetical protein